MKIPIDRGLKIALLKSLKQGYIDTRDIPQLVQVLSKDYHPFMELMKEAAASTDEAT